MQPLNGNSSLIHIWLSFPAIQGIAVITHVTQEGVGFVPLREHKTAPSIHTVPGGANCHAFKGHAVVLLL